MNRRRTIELFCFHTGQRAKKAVARLSSVIVFLATVNVNAQVPFQDIPRPVSGPSSLAALASESELANEATYAQFNRASLREIHSRYVLGEQTALDATQLSEIYEIVLAATETRSFSSSCMFEPRHYFKYMSDYGIVEVLMCFQCEEVVMVVNDWHTRRALKSSFQSRINAKFEKYDVPVPVTK